METTYQYNNALVELMVFQNNFEYTILSIPFLKRVICDISRSFIDPWNRSFPTLEIPTFKSNVRFRICKEKTLQCTIISIQKSYLVFLQDLTAGST